MPRAQWWIDGPVSDGARLFAANKLKHLERVRKANHMTAIRKRYVVGAYTYVFYLSDTTQQIRISVEGGVNVRFLVYDAGTMWGLRLVNGEWTKVEIRDLTAIPAPFTFSWSGEAGCVWGTAPSLLSPGFQSYFSRYAPAYGRIGSRSVLDVFGYTGRFVESGPLGDVYDGDPLGWLFGVQSTSPKINEATDAATRTCVRSVSIFFAQGDETDLGNGLVYQAPFTGSTYGQDPDDGLIGGVASAPLKLERYGSTAETEGIPWTESFYPRFVTGASAPLVFASPPAGLYSDASGVRTICGPVSTPSGFLYVKAGVHVIHGGEDKVYDAEVGSWGRITADAPGVSRYSYLLTYAMVSSDGTKIAAHTVEYRSSAGGAYVSTNRLCMNALVELNHAAETASVAKIDDVLVKGTSYAPTGGGAGVVTEKYFYNGYGFSGNDLVHMQIARTDVLPPQTTTIEIYFDGAKAFELETPHPLYFRKLRVFDVDWAAKKAVIGVHYSEDYFDDDLEQFVTGHYYKEYALEDGVAAAQLAQFYVVTTQVGAPDFPIPGNARGDVADPYSEEPVYAFAQPAWVFFGQDGINTRYMRDRDGNTLFFHPVAQEARKVVHELDPFVEGAVALPGTVNEPQLWQDTREYLFGLYDSDGNEIDLTHLGFSDIEAIGACDGLTVPRG